MPPRKSGDRASCRRERGGTTKLAPVPTARCRRQWRRERRATATAPREVATTPTTTRREPVLPSTTHYAESASCRYKRAAAVCHAAASAVARPSRHQYQQRGAAGGGAVSDVRRRPPLDRMRPRRRPHAESASRRALCTTPRERAAAREEWRPRAMPPRARRHGRAGTRNASAAPRAAALRVLCNGDRSQRGSEHADDHTQRARATESYAPHQARDLPPRRSGGRAPCRRQGGDTTEPAPGTPARRRGQRRRERRATATAHREEAIAPTATHREREASSTTHRAGRVTCRHGKLAAVCDVPQRARRYDQTGTSATARRRRQRRRERCATATAPREQATAPTTTRREREPPSTTQRDESASRRYRRAAAERHVAASAAARLSRRQERQRGAAGSGGVSATLRRPTLRGSHCADDHTQRARAAKHYIPRQESDPPPRKSGDRSSSHRERCSTTEPAPGAPARRCGQRRCERRATATTPGK